ncbi:MAG: Rab family GTPase [Candidatus Hermodarchaeota archaeon]
MNNRIKNRITAIGGIILLFYFITAVSLAPYLSMIGGLLISFIVVLLITLTIMLIYFIGFFIPGIRMKFEKKNSFDASWIRANIGVKEDVFEARVIHANLGVKKKVINADWIKVKMNEYNRYRQIPSIEKEINQYITLKLEHGRTFIYINGRMFIQCIRLILNIPKNDVPLYDEVESIDEAAKLYNKHLYQNRVVTGPGALPVPEQNHDITPEQEFWAHCSNIQAWVENDYDTRILMSNISFPLLRQLTRAGDPKAKKVYKEEIALRLESGYPSVVQYLLLQGYIAELNPTELQAIIESTDLLEKLSSDRTTLYQFLRYFVSKFPSLKKFISLHIQKLLDEKKISFSLIQWDPILSSLNLRLPNIVNNRSEQKKTFSGKNDSIYKVILVGDPAVGKTELLKKFVTKQFETRYLPTVGVNIVKEPIKLDDLNATVNLMLWELAGQLQFHMLHRPYFNGADGMILVFDITRSSSFSNINNWYSKAVKYGLSGIPRILIGNKMDLVDDRKIILPMAEHLSEKLNAPYFETSAITGENVKKIFTIIGKLVYKSKESFD